MSGNIDISLYKEILEKCDFSENMITRILKDLDVFLASDQCREMCESYVSLYKGGSLNYDSLLTDSVRAASLSGLSEYECRFLLSTILLPYSYQYFVKEGLSERVWLDSILDFKGKACECLQIYGTVGIFSPWMGGWYFGKRAAFGRLVFEPCPADYDYDFGEYSVKKGDIVIGVHIPSCSRYKFCREAFYDSYRQAYEYYSARLGTPVIFRCNSWLTWEKNNELLPEDSNIRSFASDYRIVATSEDASYHMWRIFGTMEREDVASLPEDTSLRRAYKSYLLSGGKIGASFGYFLYDQKLGGK